jgi:adenylate kinase
MRLIILGPQASGKGTQAAMLAEKLDIPHISTGEIFRQNIKGKTKLGELALTYINKGALVPDEVVNNIVEESLKREESFILDGFPRNLVQAKALDSFTKIDKAIEISISDDEAMKRITGRRTCEKCGEVYSLYQKGMDFNNVCKKCGGKLIIRSDDKPDAVKKRLEIYHEETEPLVEFYREKGLLLKINGERPIQDIFNDIIKKLKK